MLKDPKKSPFTFDSQEQQLISFLEQAEREIRNAILKTEGPKVFGATPIVTRNKKAWLLQRQAEINAYLIQLKNKSEEWAKSEIQGASRKGHLQIVDLYKKNKSRIPKQAFRQMNKSAINALTANFREDFGNAIGTIGSRVSREAKKLQNEMGSQSLISGWTKKEFREEFILRMERAGLVSPDGLKVRVGGYRGTAKSYAEMIARTTLHEAARSGTISTMFSAGQDLMQVVGPTIYDDVCVAWVGCIVSISGKDKRYPTLADAKASGVFHPNCVHTLAPYIEKFATKAQKEHAAKAERERKEIAKDA